MKKVEFLGLVKVSSILASVALAGCSGADVTANGVEVGEEDVATTSQTLRVENPQGAYFAEITGMGKGCRPDTWSADISPDGQTFTVVFSEYEANVSPGVKVAQNNCQLSVKLRSPSGLSYSIGNFFYTGDVFLDGKGMTAEQRAKYYFQGNPIESANGRTLIKGPTNPDGRGRAQVQSYTYDDEIGIPDLVWSPCGVERKLNIQTSMNITNNEAASGSGYITTISADGSLKLVFRVNWRACQ